MAPNPKPHPAVSIVVPVFNAGALLEESIASLLGQTYQDFEVLVHDDGSDDGGCDFVERLTDPRVRFFRDRNHGKSWVLNRALDQARGRYFVVQDADDASHPTRLERQVTFLDANPQIAAIFTGHELILNARRTAPRFREIESPECARLVEALRMPALDPTAMYRLDAVEDLRFDEELRIGQGLDFILRLGERHPLAVLGECLYAYRVHSTSITQSDWRARALAIHEVIRRACLRRGIDVEERLADFPIPQRPSHRDLDNNLVAHFMESALDLRRAGRWTDAVRSAHQCARLHPLDVTYWKPFLFATLPLSVVKRLRRRAIV